VIQSCISNSFDGLETGPASEFHFWLRTEANAPDKIEDEDTFKLPDQYWYSLTSAAGNPRAREYLQSFGFNPYNLQNVEFHKKGGVVIFQNRGKIEWTINGHGRGFRQLDVNHVLSVEASGPDSAGHHIDASISDPMMDQPGRVYIQTHACEPFLHKGEGFAAVIHRMSGLEANIDWRMQNIT
jgi:hypothetical protein